MKLSFFKKEKIIKFSILIILTICLLSIVYKLESIECYDYVDDLCYECNDIDDLTNYIDYNMLSKSLKQLISKDNFVFSNTEEKYHFCNLIMNLDYDYNRNNNVYSTNQFRNDLAERITIDDKRYLISVTIVFKPRWFSKTQIVDLDASIMDISI